LENNTNLVRVAEGDIEEDILEQILPEDDCSLSGSDSLQFLEGLTQAVLAGNAIQPMSPSAGGGNAISGNTALSIMHSGDFREGSVTGPNGETSTEVGKTSKEVVSADGTFPPPAEGDIEEDILEQILPEDDCSLSGSDSLQFLEGLT
jgi:hypothetical protein